VKDRILNALSKIEHDFDVNIIFACESGSRAWGFPSKDSDYDVRFIYTHPRDWYLTIGDKKDVIELPVNPVLDINGWDIKKSLQLLRKSNAPLLEWLSSPIVYKEVESAMTGYRDLAEQAFLPESTFYHYLSMGKKMAEKIKEGFGEKQRVKLKTYLYTLRPILCAEWIADHRV
jgi:predicted nucleotidyltransferase